MNHRRDFLKLIGATAAFSSLRAADTAPRRKIRIGQIGVGHAHAAKLSVYRQSPDYEVVGVVETDAALRQGAGEHPAFRGVPWMTREQLLHHPGLEAVLVETQVGHLLGTAEACIAAGKHIHLDKPAGTSLAPFRRLLEEAERRNLLVQMGYMYRYNPGMVWLRDILARGWLGEIFEVEAVMSKVVEPKDRLKLADYPGGIMFELGCHLIDLVVGLLGQPTRVTPFARRVRTDLDTMPDNMLAVLEYPKALATIKSSAVEVEGFARRHLTLCGTEGTLHIQPLDNPAARLSLSKARGEFHAGIQDVPLPRYVRYVDDAADMAKILHGEKKAEFTYRHDLTVQEVVLQASGV